MKSQPLSLQAGLTLLEMVIGLSIIVLVLVLAIASFDQNSGRAQSLEAKMQLVRAGVLRFQTDLPCGPAKLSALTRREDAAVGLCGDSNDLNNWRGPYIDSGSIYVNDGDSDISNILSGASLAITQKVVNSTIYTILKVSEISDEMRSAMVALCSDDCTPYKNITGDVDTIGILVSRLSLQALNQGGDVVAFGVTPAVPAGPVVLKLAIQPPPFVPPAITLPSSTIAPYVGPSALLAMAPTPTPPPPMPQQLQLPLPPPPPPPPPPPAPAPAPAPLPGFVGSGYKLFTAPVDLAVLSFQGSIQGLRNSRIRYIDVPHSNFFPNDTTIDNGYFSGNMEGNNNIINLIGAAGNLNGNNNRITIANRISSSVGDNNVITGPCLAGCSIRGNNLTLNGVNYGPGFIWIMVDSNGVAKYTRDPSLPPPSLSMTLPLPTPLPPLARATVTATGPAISASLDGNIASQNYGNYSDTNFSTLSINYATYAHVSNSRINNLVLNGATFNGDNVVIDNINATRLYNHGRVIGNNITINGGAMVWSSVRGENITLNGVTLGAFMSISGKNITVNGVNYGPKDVEVSSFNDGVLVVRYRAP